LATEVLKIVALAAISVKLTVAVAGTETAVSALVHRH
jgi:hypothetical protein